MAVRSVRLRERAATDIDQAASYCIAHAGTAVALRFVDATENVLGQIGRSPQSGSLHFSFELEIPGLRFRPFSRFPYLVFYLIGDAVVDVWRVLHTRRDARTALAEHLDP